MIEAKIVNLHLRSWPSGGRGLFPSSAPGFKSHCARLSPLRCFTCSLGLQDVQWAVRLVVMHANWPGHPCKYKKKLLTLPQKSIILFKNHKKNE
jgi:hypothetical protein